ncbi:sporulation protein Cse60 [Pseudalkalibacillus sp. SCS-8]|uniref:sporulation protein Cse60 n=1 Tax=Pseudalkalibacillus nanhaiensis TaxID=3115291 RepID=UPI0032D9E91C
MLKVKIFEAEHEEDLEESVNDFLATLLPSKFIEIQYQVSIATDEESEEFETLYSFSALILYKE